MNTIVSLDEAIRLRRHECAEAVSLQFRKSVRAIFASEHDDHLEQVGSCLLIQVDERRYVVTAAHLMDRVRTHGLFVEGAIGAKLVPITGETKLSIAPRGRDLDKIDVAFWEVNEVTRHQLGEVEFLDEQRWSFNRAVLDNRLYLMMGYPIVKNKQSVDRSTLSIKPTLGKFTGELQENPILARQLGVSGNEHFFLTYPNYSETEHGHKVNSIVPVGYSGGGLIDLGNFASPTKMLPEAPTGRLAGMIIERNKRHRAMIAVRLEVVVAGIRKEAARVSEPK